MKVFITMRLKHFFMALMGGISRCVKCDDSLAILVEDERNAEEQKAGTDDGKVLRG